MCKLLGISRSLVYYHINRNKELIESIDNKEVKLSREIKEIFRKSKNNYGTRKI